MLYVVLDHKNTFLFEVVLCSELVTMKVSNVLCHVAGLLATCQCALAASGWTFADATLTVQGKGSGVGSGLKEKYGTLSFYGTYQLTC